MPTAKFKLDNAAELFPACIVMFQRNHGSIMPYPRIDAVVMFSAVLNVYSLYKRLHFNAEFPFKQFPVMFVLCRSPRQLRVQMHVVQRLF